jgi:hypothetical protein
MSTTEAPASNDLRSFNRSILSRSIREAVDAKMPVLFEPEIRGAIEYIKVAAYEAHAKRSRDKGEAAGDFESYISKLMNGEDE